MGDEDRGERLPHRVRGAAQTAAFPSGSALSGELRQRIQAAVVAERSAQGPADQEATSPSVRGAVKGRRRRLTTVPAARPAQPAPAVSAGPGAEDAEDEVTEWLGRAGPASAQSPPAAASTSAPGPDPSQAVARLVAQVLVAVLVFGLLTAAAVRHFVLSPGTGAAGGALAGQEAATRDAAAVWVLQQVSHDVTVSCDPAMCAALRAHGFPSRHLMALGPASPYPVRSQVVVETAAVQGWYGTSLAAAWAPAVLASFGSGPAAIAVRVVAPYGAAAYQTKLAAAQAASQAAGAALLTDPRVIVPPPASGQLTGGLVDSRLLRALRALAVRELVSVVQFGNAGPGASADIPLRFADLAEDGQATGPSGAAYVRAVRAYLSGVSAAFRPASMTTVVLADGQAVLRVGFAAPSPLTVPGSPRSR